MTAVEKKCACCGVVKPIGEYTRNKNRKDGLSVYCKPCGREKNRASAKKHLSARVAKQKEWRRENPERVGQYHARWREANRERARDADRKWREANPDKRKAVCAEYRRRNTDADREYRLAYRERNPGVVRARLAMYRATMRRATPAWFGDRDRKALLALCAEAQRREKFTGEKWHVDHVIPLRGKTVCGLHCAANWQLLPAKVNLSKSNKLDFRENT